MTTPADYTFEDFAWTRTVEVVSGGRKRSVRLSLDGEAHEPIEQQQLETANRFMATPGVFGDAEKALFSHFLAHEDDFRDRVGSLPPTLSAEEFPSLVTLQEIVVGYQFSDKRRLGALFESPLEPEHGLAVVFENERVAEVGLQDIAL